MNSTFVLHFLRKYAGIRVVAFKTMFASDVHGVLLRAGSFEDFSLHPISALLSREAFQFRGFKLLSERQSNK
jgi:hypothetical protein